MPKKQTKYNQIQGQIKDIQLHFKSMNGMFQQQMNGNVMLNGLQDLVYGFQSPNPNGPMINNTTSLEINLRRYLVTVQRPTLNYLYQENGLIRTFVDEPVDDALRGGVDIESDQLSTEDIQRLQEALDEDEAWETVKTAGKWARLFGGGGIVINNGQDPSTPLDLTSMNEKTPFQMWDCDRWELTMPNDDHRPETLFAASGTTYFQYYTVARLHRSRVLSMKGDVAPSLTRRMLMGWGLSIVEKAIRDINQYIKATNLIFELLDEAKIDVYKMKDYTSALAMPGGDARIRNAMGLTNSMKNYLNAVLMDKEDDYEQKTMTFSGLAEMLKEIRIGIASTLRMPVTKLFGISAAGFNSGEDDIENYNAMIESDIRPRLRPIIKQVLHLYCMKVFGYIPENLTFKFKSLRILGSVEEADIKVKEQTMVLANFDRGLMTEQESMEAQRIKGIIVNKKTKAELGMIDGQGKPKGQGQDPLEA